MEIGEKTTPFDKAKAKTPRQRGNTDNDRKPKERASSGNCKADQRSWYSARPVL